MLVWSIALAVGLIGSILYVIRLKREIRHLVSRLTDICEQETNQELTSLTGQPDISVLAARINRLIRKQKELMIEIKTTDHEFRQAITNMSHDLRTPLTSAKGYIQMARNSHITKEKRREYMMIVEQRILALNRLLDEFFEFSRIQSDEYLIQPELVNLNTLLCETAALYYEDFTAQNRAVQISLLDRAVYLFCDVNAMTRIFQNLIHNSIRYGGGDLQISLVKSEEYIEMHFADQTAEEIDASRVFERFYVEDSSRSSKSTGLGLSIVKLLVEKMDGTVRAEAEKGMLKFILRFNPVESPLTP